jgi:formate dehydrogenase subunit gamma
MTQTVGYPILAITGLILWASKIAFLSWLIHIGMAALAAPLVLGHMYMAVINRSTRAGLGGMFSGYVDREWARHHYALWYREHFGKDHRKPPQRAEDVPDAQAAEAFD